MQALTANSRRFDIMREEVCRKGKEHAMPTPYTPVQNTEEEPRKVCGVQRGSCLCYVVVVVVVLALVVAGDPFLFRVHETKGSTEHWLVVGLVGGSVVLLGWGCLMCTGKAAWLTAPCCGGSAAVVPEVPKSELPFVSLPK